MFSFPPNMDSDDSVSYMGEENTTAAQVMPNPPQIEEIQLVTGDGSNPIELTPPKATPQPPKEPTDRNNDLSEDVLKAMLAAKKKEKKRVKDAERRAAKKSTTSESLPSTGSTQSLVSEKKRKTASKKTNEKKRQKIAEELLKMYSAKKKGGHGKANKKDDGNKKRHHGIDALIAGNVDEDEEDEDEDDAGETEESTDMEEDETRSLGADSVEYEERKVARAKRARRLVQENMLNRSGLLTIQKKGILIHHCDKCKKRQLDRTTELMFKTSIDDIYFLQIELCASCIESNFKLSEQYKRLWIDREPEKNGANNPVAATAPRFHISQGEDCTGADDKLMKFKFVWILHQCNTCVQQQRAMANDIFLRKIDTDMYQLSFVVCGICSVSNNANQTAINRYFSNFKK